MLSETGEATDPKLMQKLGERPGSTVLIDRSEQSEKFPTFFYQEKNV